MRLVSTFIAVHCKERLFSLQLRVTFANEYKHTCLEGSLMLCQFSYPSWAYNLLRHRLLSGLTVLAVSAPLVTSLKSYEMEVGYPPNYGTIVQVGTSCWAGFFLFVGYTDG